MPVDRVAVAESGAARSGANQRPPPRAERTAARPIARSVVWHPIRHYSHTSTTIRTGRRRRAARGNQTLHPNINLVRKPTRTVINVKPWSFVRQRSHRLNLFAAARPDTTGNPHPLSCSRSRAMARKGAINSCSPSPTILSARALATFPARRNARTPTGNPRADSGCVALLEKTPAFWASIRAGSPAANAVFS